MRTEITLFCCALSGILLWLGGFIYSVEITAASLLLLAAVYFPFGFYFLYDEPGNLVYAFIAGLLLSAAPLCVLLNLVDFKGARWQAGIGSCVLPVLLVATLLMARTSPPAKQSFYKRHAIRVGAWLLIVFSFFAAGHVRMPTF